MMRKTDDQIRKEVLDELEWDSRLASSEIGAHVKDGVVTLIGTTASYAAKLAAEEGVHRIPGVLDVANDIQVRSAGKAARSDSELAQAVRRALEWDALVEDENIHSTVSEGWVTLSGAVDRLREREDAEHAVRHLIGVRGVTNAIEVVGPPPNVEKLRQRLRGALERRARREARHIQVRVEEHSVTLSGKVDSWREQRAVLGIVSHTPGVRRVKDALEVDPYHS
jgi:osmotically-inducible protein OsmY